MKVSVPFTLCMHGCEACVASRMPDHAAAGCGGRHRKGTIGGAAYGIPVKTAMLPCCLPAIVPLASRIVGPEDPVCRGFCPAAASVESARQRQIMRMTSGPSNSERFGIGNRTAITIATSYLTVQSLIMVATAGPGSPRQGCTVRTVTTKPFCAKQGAGIEHCICGRRFIHISVYDHAGTDRELCHDYRRYKPNSS